MFRYYAGIGSRKTPIDVRNKMVAIATQFANLNYILRSGGAAGADKAFERGANAKDIFKPKPNSIDFETRKKIHRIIRQLHPNWLGLSNFAKLCHERNVQIVLGEKLDTPVDFLVCWTPEAEDVGGTAMGIKVAKKYGIPVFNIADEQRLEDLRRYYAIVKDKR